MNKKNDKVGALLIQKLYTMQTVTGI